MSNDQNTSQDSEFASTGPIDFGEQTDAGSDPGNAKGSSKKHGLSLEKGSVTERDIFSLAKIILLVSAIIYLTLAILNVLDFPSVINSERMNAIWDYSKVFLNSIISLVLGLYFGAKKESSKKDGQT